MSPRSTLFILLAGLHPFAAAHALAAQTLRVTPATENFRAAPGGIPIATLEGGTSLRAGRSQERWREGTLEGWVSAQLASRAGSDSLELRPRSTIRSAPEGSALARAGSGLRVREVERRDGWVRVRRNGWIWEESVVASAAAAPQARPQPPAATASEAPSSATPSAPARTALLDAPGGDTVAVLLAADAAPLERRGEWARVRVEGWMRAPTGAPQPGAVTLAALRAEPEGFRGRRVRWNAQFIALERAESIRSDFTPGEPYLLARDPNGETGLVYIAVPPGQIAAAERLTPFQRFRFVARVRTASSPLMGHPVLELISLGN